MLLSTLSAAPQQASGSWPIKRESGGMKGQYNIKDLFLNFESGKASLLEPQNKNIWLWMISQSP